MSRDTAYRVTGHSLCVLDRDSKRTPLRILNDPVMESFLAPNFNFLATQIIIVE